MSVQTNGGLDGRGQPLGCHLRAPLSLVLADGRAQVLGLGRNPQAIAHDGLNEHAGDFAAVLFEHVLELVRVIGLDEVGVGAGSDRNAFAVGVDFRLTFVLPLLHGRVPHGRVEQAVVPTLQDDVVVPTGEGARKPEPSHDGLRTGVREAHQLRRRHHLRDTVSNDQFALGREREDAADLHAPTGRFVDPRIRVAENRRTVAQPVVDIVVVVDVGDSRAAPALDVDSPVFAPVSEVRRDTERKPLTGALELFIAFREFSGHGGLSSEWLPGFAGGGGNVAARIR